MPRRQKPSFSQKTFRYLWRFCSLLFRVFFVALFCLETQCSGLFSWLFRGFFVAFSWFFRGPRFGQILRVLALEQSSDFQRVQGLSPSRAPYVSSVADNNELRAPCAYTLCIGQNLDGGHFLNFLTWKSPRVGCTPRGSCNRTLLRRVLRRFSDSKCFLEGFLEGACKGFQ